MSDDQTTPQAGDEPAALPGHLPSLTPAADPFARPLSADAPPAPAVDGGTDDEDDDDDDDEDPAPAPAPGPPRASAKAARTRPGRPGGGGPKMRAGALRRLDKLKGKGTGGAAWAQALREEAARAEAAVGEPAHDEPQAEEEHAEPGGAAQAAPEVTPEADAQPTGAASSSPGSSTSNAATIMGQPAERVLALVPITGAFWGNLARKSEGTPWDFTGERTMTVFPGSPFERSFTANSERQLTELSAVLVAKHAAKVTDKVDAPETLMAGALLFAFGPQALQRVGDLVKNAADWWRRRRGGG